MQADFYDVKEKKKVTVEVTDKQEFKTKNGLRYALKAKTKDGRNLTKFTSKEDYDKAQV